MKRVKMLKLSELSKKELNDRQLKELKGGDYCSDKCGTDDFIKADKENWWNGYFYS